MAVSAISFHEIAVSFVNLKRPLQNQTALRTAKPQLIRGPTLFAEKERQQMHTISRKSPTFAVIAALTFALAASPATAEDGIRYSGHLSRHRGRPPVTPKTEPAKGATARPPIDDLYRRRGTGIGGTVFGLGAQGGLSIAGTCADLRSVVSPSCGHGYGIYGNGLGYGFGF